MPDASGRFVGYRSTAKTAESWERIFGKPEPETLWVSRECENCGVYGWCEYHDEPARPHAAAIAAAFEEAYGKPEPHPDDHLF